MIKKISLPQKICELIHSLSYEVEGNKILYCHMLHAYPEDNELIEKLQNNFMDSLTEKNLVFSQIRKDYLNNCTKDFSIDFDDNCILIEGDI